MDKVIIVDNLSKDYPLNKGKKTLSALKGISFDVYKGEIFGILGPNGAGKTTTLEMIETLRPIDGGQASINGIDVSKHPQTIKRIIGVQPKVQHGVNCEKQDHGDRTGHLHGATDDGPYGVDGLKYCGRCHWSLP